MSEVNFKELNILVLSLNEISDINVLEKVHFKELNLLELVGNNINKEENYQLITNLKSKIKKFSV